LKAARSIAKGRNMAKLTWHAYYFASLDKKSPVARMAVIEAESEDDAGKIAIAQMGRYMRVDVTQPLWGAHHRANPTPWGLAERAAPQGASLAI
jgi:hypothetical protein